MKPRHYFLTPLAIFEKQKEVKLLDKKMTTKLRQEYPSHVPLRVAAPLLGVSERQLARLVAEGRRPFWMLAQTSAIGSDMYAFTQSGSLHI